MLAGVGDPSHRPVTVQQLRFGGGIAAIRLSDAPDWVSNVVRQAFTVVPGVARPDVVITADGGRPHLAQLRQPADPAYRRGCSTPAELILNLSRCLEPILTRRAPEPILHAGAVAVGEAAIILVGMSGAGKSTLVARLAAARGVKVLTDEAVAVTPGGAIEGFTRPVHLRARHDMVLEGWTPFGSTEGFEMLGAPKAPGGPHEPATALVAILDRRNEGSTRAVEFNRLSKADSARLLAANAFNLLETGPDRLAALADWSAQVEAFRITYCDSRMAAMGLLQLSGSLTPPRPSRVDWLDIKGRRGRAARFLGSMLIVSADGRSLISVKIDDRDVSLPGDERIDLPPALLSEIDRVFGSASW